MRPNVRFMLGCLLALTLTSCAATPQVAAPVQDAMREYIQNRCNAVDTPCGDWRITRVKDLTISVAAQKGGADTAWCIDYALQRLNTGRYTSWFLHWANIPEAAIVVKRTNGQYESFGSNTCDITVLE